MTLVKGTLRELSARRLSLVILMTLEAVGVAALFVGGMLIHAVLVKPVPFPRADEVVQVWHARPETSWTHLMLNRNEVEFYRAQARSLESLVPFTTRDVIATIDGASQSQRAVVLAGDLCELLGVNAVVGRCLSLADAAPSASPVAVMRAGAASVRYGDPTKALDAEVVIEGRLHRIVGVVPDNLNLRSYLSHFLGPVDYMLPLLTTENQRTDRRLMLMGRLVPQASLAGATAELETLSRAYAAQLPDVNDGRVAWLVTLHDETVEYARPQALAIAMGAVLLAMLVIFNSFVVRKAEAGRRRLLFLLKSALGASSRRLLAEEACSSLLTLAASGVLAWNLSNWLITQFVQSEPWGVAGLRNDEASLLYFVLALTLVGGASVIGGLLVVRHFLHSGDSFSASPSRTVGSTRAEARGTRTMMLTQCAITAVLLGCTLLLTKTMWNLANVDLGVRAPNLMTVRTVIPPALAATPEHRQSVMTQILDRERLPIGIESIAMINAAPLSRRAALRPVEVAGWRGSDDGPPVANYRLVSANYFDVAGVPVVAGRVFAGPQRSGAAEYLVNHAFVRRFLNGRDPIGTVMRIPQEGGVADDGLASEGAIVGVVGDVKHWGPDRPVPVEIYLSYEIDPPAGFDVVFRAHPNSERPAVAMQRYLHAIAPELAAFPVRTIEADVRSALSTHSFAVVLFGLFAVAAILITALGLFGVASGYVTSRHGEIAVRMSIGATPRDVVQLVARQALVPAVAGAVVGAIVLIGAGRMLQVWLYEVRATDPGLLAMVPTGIVAVAVMAVLGPLRAALRIEAIELLRGR